LTIELFNKSLAAKMDSFS